MNHGQFTARDSRVLRPGFTFVELLCVLIVLGMIAAVAVPRYANAITRGRVEAAARRITTDLALAQRTAKFTGKSRKVAFDPFLDKYYMPSIRDPDHFSEAYQVFLGDEPYNTAMISADFNGDGDLIFDGHGVPDSGGTVIIQIGDHRKELTIAAQTAHVTVVDVAPVGDVTPVPKGLDDKLPVVIK